jgi:hypothetical protein
MKMFIHTTPLTHRPQPPMENHPTTEEQTTTQRRRKYSPPSTAPEPLNGVPPLSTVEGVATEPREDTKEGAIQASTETQAERQAAQALNSFTPQSPNDAEGRQEEGEQEERPMAPKFHDQRNDG